MKRDQARGGKRRGVWAGNMALLIVLALGGSVVTAAPGPAAAPAWTLVWSEEFTGPAGSQPSGTIWNYETGGDGWGNNELQSYTARPQNVALEGAGNLA